MLRDEPSDTEGDPLYAAFYRWLADAGDRLPVSIAHLASEGDALFFRLEGWPDLRGVVVHDGLAVEAIRDGTCWDIILDLDADPQAAESGVVCTLCRDGRVWSSRDALWADHLWQPFEKWLGELADATGIEWGGSAGDATWASLRRD